MMLIEEGLTEELRLGLKESRRKHVVLLGDLLDVPDPIRSRQSIRALRLDKYDWNCLYELCDRVCKLRGVSAAVRLDGCRTLGQLADAIWGKRRKR